MQLDTFYALRDWLVMNTDLKGDNIIYNRRIRGQGRQVSIEEKLVIFIYIISNGASNRNTSERFSQSNNTISWYISLSKERKITNNFIAVFMKS
jgi:stringent starvation protein B